MEEKQAYYDWYQETWNTARWLGMTFPVTVMGLLIVMTLIIRCTRFGQRFWLVTGKYFVQKSSWSVWLLVMASIVLELLRARITVLSTYWSSDLFTALQQLDEKNFGSILVVGVIIIFLQVAGFITPIFVENTLSIHWRKWLNQRVFTEWATDNSFYKIRFLHPENQGIDNPDQRIEYDVADFTDKTTSLVFGSIMSLVTLYGAATALWGIADTMNIGGIELPKALFWGAMLLAITMMFLGFWIGMPLIRLNYTKQQRIGNFRFSLVRMRINAEKIALHKGSHAEIPPVQQRFARVIKNAWRLLFASTRLNAFTMTTSIAPTFLIYLVQAPRVFAQTITMGNFMQSAGTFGLIQQTLSFFSESFGSFAQYSSTVTRLSGLIEQSAQSRTLPALTTQRQPEGIRLEGVTLWSREGSPLIENLSLTVNPGESLLVDWPSGSGKSTLFLALAGLWPYAEGDVLLPSDDQVMFLPQAPYFPLGTLRAALHYPQESTKFSDSDLLRVLDEVQLKHLEDRLDEEETWEEILSPGEQQRVIFARILLQRPRALFLDEATSAMDEGMEYAMHALLEKNLPQAAIISIGHRPSLRKWHSKVLRLQENCQWELLEKTSSA